MALKQGMDQILAWILALAGAGAVYGVGFAVAKIASRHNQEETNKFGEISDESHEAAEHESGAHKPKHGEHSEAELEESEHGKGAHGKEEHGKEEHGTESHGHSKNAPHHEKSEHEGSEHGHHESRTNSTIPHWDYKGSTGPDHWGTLSDDFRLCQSGRQQSPVDIDGPISNSKLLPIRFHYQDSDAVVQNDGRTISARLQTGNYVEVDGDRFDLEELHFHAPSEHKVVGAPYDLELHLSHKDQDGRLLMIGVFFEQETTNKDLAKFWQSLPEPGEYLPEPVSLNPNSLLPSRKTYFTYSGSMSTPPCTEGVKWFVFMDPMPISSKQLEAFTRVVPFNARPLQPLYSRKIAKSTRS